MSDKVSCTYCDRSYDVDFSKGNYIRCFCGKLIRLPEMPSQRRSEPYTITSHSTPKPKQEQPKLIDCPDCGTSISSSAFFCPKCGRPSSVAADRAKTQGCVMMLLQYVLFGLVFNETLKWILQ